MALFYGFVVVVVVWESVVVFVLFALFLFYFGQATTPSSIVKWSKMQNKTYTTKQYNNEEKRGLRHCANASLSCLHLHRGQRVVSVFCLTPDFPLPPRQ